MPRIESYSFGRMAIDGRIHTSDLLIFPDGTVRDAWWRRSGHGLSREDLARVVEAGAQVIVIGTGSVGLMRVGNELVEALKAEGVETRVGRTGEAAAIYNGLAHRQDVAAGFHLTC